MCHVGAFLHLCHFPVGWVSMTVSLKSYTTKQLTDFWPLFFYLSDEIGLSLSIPVISAGSFGLSCDYKPKLTRILPPARKIADLFVHFVKEVLPFKERWEQIYVYKKPKSSNASEDCFWWDNTCCNSPDWPLRLLSALQHVLVLSPCLCHRYINALEAPSEDFASYVNREMLRGEEELKGALTAKKRHSNSEHSFFVLIPSYCIKHLFLSLSSLEQAWKQFKHFLSCYSDTDLFISVVILCGGPQDVVSVKGILGPVHEDIMFILLDIYK